MSYNQLDSMQFNLESYHSLLSVDISHNHIGEYQVFFYSTRVRYINVTGNMLSVLGSNALRDVPSIRSLVGLEAAQFANNAFDGVSDLQELSIVFHHKSISTDILNHLKLLEDLDVDFRQSTRLPIDLLWFGNDSLRSLTMRLPSVTQIHEDTFLGLSMLESVKIIAPRLHSLPSYLFHREGQQRWQNAKMPIGLREIQLSGIALMPNNIFSQQQRLERLELHGLEKIESGTFESVTLDYLDLSHSKIFSVAPGLFSNLRSLKVLNLHNTSLQYIDDDSFYNLDSLQELDLSHNELRLMKDSTFDHIRNLVQLNIRENRITALDPPIFEHLRALEILDISHNRIETIEPTLFSTLGKLQELYIHHNRLTYVPEHCLDVQVNLINLNMATNELQMLPSGLFTKAEILRKLDISNNNIAELPQDFFSHTYYLEDVNLSGNPVYCGCPIIILKREKPDLEINGVCATPEEHRGQPISNIFDQTCQHPTTTTERSAVINVLPHIPNWSTSGPLLPTQSISTTAKPRQQEKYSTPWWMNNNTYLFNSTGLPFPPEIGKGRIFEAGGAGLTAFYVALVVFGTVLVVASVASGAHRRRQRQRSAIYEVNQDHIVVEPQNSFQMSVESDPINLSSEMERQDLETV